MSVRWVISCEHGGNRIPAPYERLFSGAREVLETHRGWDPGALALFHTLEPLADFSYSSTDSRLLVELNRSLHHPALFSDYTRRLSEDEKAQVLLEYYHPYRKKIEKAIKVFIQQGHQVNHLSIHSFTPVLQEEVRKADIGLLYDPGRALEKKLCTRWKQLLQERLPDFVIRFNYPYRGTADGFTTYLRKAIGKGYAGIEVELNQQWAGDKNVYQAFYKTLESLKK